MISLTLPGPTVTREVTWERLDAWLTAHGWLSMPYDGGLGWRHRTLSKEGRDILHTGGAYGQRKNHPPPYGTDLITLVFSTLARLYGRSPGEILAEVADP